MGFNLLISVLLIAMILVGGTIAYMEATDNPVLNTFAMADVNIELHEEGNKVVTTKNTGKSPAFVRARVEISSGTFAVVNCASASEVPADANRADNTIYVVWGDWEKAADGYYYYKGVLAPNATTTPVVNGVYGGRGVVTGSFDVLVYAESALGSGTYSLSAAQAAFAAVD